MSQFKDIFDLGVDSIKEYTIMMSKDSFIEKSIKTLKSIETLYASCFYILKEDALCHRCNGFCYIEESGNTIECPSCLATGHIQTTKFDCEKFVEKMNNLMFDNESDFYRLLSAKIKD